MVEFYDNGQFVHFLVCGPLNSALTRRYHRFFTGTIVRLWVAPSSPALHLSTSFIAIGLYNILKSYGDSVKVIHQRMILFAV